MHICCQLIRYFRACGSYHDFLDRRLLPTRKLPNKGFLVVKLMSSLRKKNSDRHLTLFNRYSYVPFVVIESRSFPHSWLGFCILLHVQCISVVCVVHFVKIHVFTYLAPYCDVRCNFRVQAIFDLSLFPFILNRIGGIMVSASSSCAVYRGFESRSGQTKDYKMGMCCFSDKHAALRRKSKDWLARNQNNVSEWSDMSNRGLLFQWVAITKSNSACWSRTKPTSSSSLWTLTCSVHDIAEILLNWR
jgi:hypothetical protein